MGSTSAQLLSLEHLPGDGLPVSGLSDSNSREMRWSRPPLPVPDRELAALVVPLLPGRAARKVGGRQQAPARVPHLGFGPRVHRCSR